MVLMIILCLYFLKEVIFADYPKEYTFVYCLGPCQGPPSDVGNTDIQRLQELARKPIRHLKCLNIEGPHPSTYILLAV